MHIFIMKQVYSSPEATGESLAFILFYITDYMNKGQQ